MHAKMEEPNTPSPALATVKAKEGEHRGPYDLPSPPVSFTKALSQHSNDDTDVKSNRTTSLDGHADLLVDESRSLSNSRGEEYLATPPSPPPSTHSSEDLHSPLRPSYFYPQPSDSDATGNDLHISPDDAPGIPVFEPTWEEFKDFYTYCQRIDEWGMKSGIVKIIPPKEWTQSLPRLDGKAGSTSIASKQLLSGTRYTEDNPLSQIRIKNSIEQIFTPAGSGSWRQSNVVHPGRVLNAKQWADLCATPLQKGPELSRMKENAKREGDDGAEKDGVRTRSGRGNRAGPGQASTFTSRTTTKRKRSSEAEKQVTAEQVAQEDTHLVDLPALEDVDSASKTKLKIADRTSQEEWNAFDYVERWCQEAGQDSCPQDWNPSVCKAIESEYWRGLNFGKVPMYGADLKGTLFTPATQHWNVGVLDNILTRLRLRRKLPGVTTPYLYFGMWRATFAWHVEDMDLYSINYIHFGAPKQWYAIRQSDRQRFELAMAGAFPGDSARCKHFMRHKSYLASPAFLAATAGIKPLRLVQKAQEFVITYPYGYHSGFNLGYNCAESVNFALESWLDIGRKAGYCDCANDSVKMDVDAMLEESKEMMELDRKREEKERKKEAEEQMMQTELQKSESRRAKERERRKAKKKEQARLESLGILPHGAREGTLDEEDSPQPAKKVKKEALPCIFCPSTSEEDLVVVPYAEDEAELNKKLIRKAHRLCACFLPETWVAPNPQWQQESKEPHEIVMGFAGIEKARWSLKCQNCFDPHSAKKGAKVQCTFRKCSRTTHVSCALYESSGWMLDMLEDEEADALEGKVKKASKNGAEDSAAQKEEVGEESAPRIVILCRSHNPKEREREAKRRADILLGCVKTLTEGQMLKIRANSGGMWETLLVDIRWPQRPSTEGEVVVDGQAVKWSKILFDAEIVKKVEFELKRSEEKGLVLQGEEIVAQPVEKDVEIKDPVKDEIMAQAILEREQAKAAEKAAKEAAKQAKEEQKRIKEEAKLQKNLEKDAKAVEREAKTKVKEQKKTEREAKKAQKMARAAEILSQKQGTSNPTADLSAHSKSSEYDYIRQWKPQNSYHHNAPRPVLPTGSKPNMDRILAPIHPHSMTSAYPSISNYPPHLATYQNRPMYQNQYQHPHQHSQVVNRSLATLSHLQYTSQHSPRPTPAMFPFHQQGYPGSQYPSAPHVQQSSHPPYPMNGAQSVHEAERSNHPMYNSHKGTALPLNTPYTS